ncbi:hypothetical protein ACNO5M_13985 [Vibrio owensii]|uniref:hypothetical protein n=1 Tax=Vibrio owensii TaxID=696485 RepID=UPI003AABD37A
MPNPVQKKEVMLTILIDKGLTKELRRVRCKANKVERVKQKYDKSGDERVIGYDVSVIEQDSTI